MIFAVTPNASSCSRVVGCSEAARWSSTGAGSCSKTVTGHAALVQRQRADHANRACAYDDDARARLRCRHSPLVNFFNFFNPRVGMMPYQIAVLNYRRY